MTSPTVNEDESSRFLVHHICYLTLRVECTCGTATMQEHVTISGVGLSHDSHMTHITEIHV